jgi:hypothetical protein
MNQKTKFLLCVIVGVCLRLGFSQLGHNNDVHTLFDVASKIESCRLTKCLDAQGEVLFVNVLPYGPLTFNLLSWADSLAGVINSNDVAGFHLVFTGLLTFFDCLMAIILFQFFGWKGGLLMMLSPISFLLTGFHGQIDGVSLSLAMLSVYFYRRSFIASILFLGASLAIKQSFAFFPLWVLFAPSFGLFRRRFLYAGLTYSSYGLFFLPIFFHDWSLVPAFLQKMSQFTVNGHGLAGTTVLRELTLFFVPERTISFLFGDSIAGFAKGYKFLFIGLMMSTGFIFARKNKDPWELFFFYPISMVALTPRLAVQYLAMIVAPMIYWVFKKQSLFALFLLGVGALLVPMQGENIIDYIVPYIGPLVYLSYFDSFYVQVYVFIFWFLAIGQLLKEQIHGLNGLKIWVMKKIVI